MKKAFTLIELLVVVLIIGILAAVAVPQYQKAVEKSRAIQAIALLSTLYQTAETYYLANGNWPLSIQKLDVAMPFNNNDEWIAWMESSNTVWGVGFTHKAGKYAGTAFGKYKKHFVNSIPKDTNLCMEFRKDHTFNFEGKRGSYCIQILGGTEVYSDSAIGVYRLP